ncbi:non-specific lipid-transfer protein 3-like [Andrographis paniculata]|uniref:non-specific lipid-transfer protein 3-like n=1 Tax=Andrographis paniculata TaxID=175694 RepID=UPI0021E83425|nr:non-specific lipid-transfer protein 3-like [Andrographis paniculata]
MASQNYKPGGAVGVVVVVVVVMMTTVMASAAGGGGIAMIDSGVASCGAVTSTLAPCYEFVVGGGGPGDKPTDSCCQGVRKLYREAASRDDRRTVCECLKRVTRAASPTTLRNAKTLPHACGVSLPFEITPQLDCNKVG